MAGDHVVYTRILEDIKIYYLGRANCLNMIVERGNFSELRHMRMELNSRYSRNEVV